MVDQRAVLRKNRNRLNIPSVAVVGYTNSGKTSLIKALTGTTKLKPKNKLFATLDVTTHGAKLPCNMNVLFLDTVRKQITVGSA
jgi:50S ribosomal subunit-associated GTPase HflX